MAEKLSLSQWMTACGIQAFDLAKRAGVTMATIREIEDPHGHPISLKKAQAIVKILSDEHGKTITLADVKDLNTI